MYITDAYRVSGGCNAGVHAGSHWESRILSGSKLLLFRGAKTQRVAFDPEAYVPLLVEEGMQLTEERLREVIVQ